MLDAAADLAEGLHHLEEAVEVGAEEALLLEKEVQEEEAHENLKRYQELAEDVRKFTATSIEEYDTRSGLLNKDLVSLGDMLKREEDIHEERRKKYVSHISDLKTKLTENHNHQERLRKELEELEATEKTLMNVAATENDEFNSLKNQFYSKKNWFTNTIETFERLKAASEGCSSIMNQTKEATEKMMSSCLETKESTNNLLTATHKAAYENYRNALVTLAVTHKIQRRDSTINVSYLQKQLDNLKDDLDKAARGALNVVVNLKRSEVKRYRTAIVSQEEIITCCDTKIDDLTKKIQQCDKTLEKRHKVKVKSLEERYKERVDEIEGRWKVDGIGPEHIAKLCLQPE